jgi:hypothetical protein
LNCTFVVDAIQKKKEIHVREQRVTVVVVPPKISGQSISPFFLENKIKAP